MTIAPTTRPRLLPLALVGLLAVGLAACADPVEERTASGDAGSVGESKIDVVSYDTSGTQERIRGTKDATLAAQVPAEVRQSGELVVGNGRAGGGTPPLTFTADDNRTPIGVEVDIAHLVADYLGLRTTISTTSFENLFLGLDSGKYDVAISNVGVSEERKEKYDFATYRLGLHAFEAPKGSGLRVEGPADIAGKTVGVSSGTLQEAILLDWDEENVAAGRPAATIRYFQNATDYYLALDSKRLDLFLGPNPTATYHVVTAGKTEIVGTVSSSYPVEGKVGVITKKGSGLAGPTARAIDKAIADGTYAKVLERWGLSAESVEKSEINPVGLPKPAAK